jgi:ribonucleoside-diphosphate reductase alpha subunit
MYVIKRNDKGVEEVSFNKIKNRHRNILQAEPKINIDPTLTAQLTIKYMHNMIKTSELDKITSEVAETMKIIKSIEYSDFAARLYHDNLNKESPKTFMGSINEIYKSKEMMYVNNINETLNLMKTIIGTIKSSDKDKLINIINTCGWFKFYKKELIDNINSFDNDVVITSVKNNIYNEYIEEMIQSIKEINNIDHVYYDFIVKNIEKIEEHIEKYANISLIKDKYDLFGLKTFENMYLKKNKGQLIDKTCYCYMRTAIHCFYPDINKVLNYFDKLNDHKVSHATPTYINSLLRYSQTISCIKTMADDNTKSIMHTAYNKALLSKYGYGISYATTNIRSSGSVIKSSGGLSNGLYPQLLIDQAIVSCFNQSGTRPGSISSDIDDYHGDIMTILDAKRPTSTLDKLKRMNLSINMHRLFYRRIIKDKKWSLFSPSVAKGLNKLHGKEFEELYKYYEKQGLFCKQVSARDLANLILLTRIETGEPYICNIDEANDKSNHINVGVCAGTNLCIEIMQYFNSSMYANCVLGAINYNDKHYFNNDYLNSIKWFNLVNRNDTHLIDDLTFARNVIKYDLIKESSSSITFALNNCIERNFYPVPEAELGAKRFRSLGIGGQGLANLFAKLRIPFTSRKARLINRYLSEVKYHGFITATCDEVEINGKDKYYYYEGSPFSKGILQYHMWNAKPEYYDEKTWDVQIKRIKTTGCYNSQGTANMPTATTSQIVGNVEGHEPYMSNIFIRGTKYGTFVVVNKYMIQHFKELGLWNENMLMLIEKDNGSVQNIKNIPQHIKDIYLTVYEMKQKDLMEMSRDRAYFVDQAESLNLYFSPDKDIEDIKERRLDLSNKIMAAMIYSYELKIKTGCYYTRTEIDEKTRFRINDIKDHSIEEKNIEIDIGKVKDPYEEEDEGCGIACKL